MYTPLENAPQGSAAWHAARAKHFCASEAAAALGLSKYTTRDELLRQISDEKYPGKGKALISFAWSPFAVEKNVILVAASDAEGLNAGVEQLIKLAK